MNKQYTLLAVVFSFCLVGLLMLSAFFIPWKNINWGKVALLPASTVTVTGTAKSQEKNQVAVYSAGVSVVSDNKEQAIADVNKKTQSLIDAVKTFGIPAADIKTQNLNVFQSEETYYEEGVQKARPGQWRVNNTIEIKLRNVDSASQLTDILSKSGANNIYGPNFSIEESEAKETSLLGEAINNAKEKANLMAQASGKKLGTIINIVEGGAQTPIALFRMEGGGAGGAPVEPGSSTVTKTVTVTFELQ